MDNLTEEEGLLQPPQDNYDTIKIFNVFPLTFPAKFLLSLFNWKKLMVGIWGILLMFYVSIAGLMKPHWPVNAKIAIITAAIAPLADYIIVLLNMYNGGWGKEKSRFWCHMRIMYLSGYNSIRWSISAVVDPCIVIAISVINGETLDNSLQAGIIVVLSYYILANSEQNKSQPIEWDKFKDDFDVKLNHINNIQMKNLKSVAIEPIVLCLILLILPWCFNISVLSVMVILYQLAVCVNAYRYCSSRQTFVVTDVQYDIIQIIFRTGLLWTFVWV